MNTSVDSDKEIAQREKENYHTTQTSMLYQTQNILKTSKAFLI